MSAQATGDKLTAAERRHSLGSTAPLGFLEHWKSCNEPGMTPENDHWKFYVNKGLVLRGGILKVDYTALYAPNAGVPFDRVLVDPDEGFLMPITRPGWQPRPYVGPRFRLIRPLSPRECDKLIAKALHIAVYTTRYAALSCIERVLDLPEGTLTK